MTPTLRAASFATTACLVATAILAPARAHGQERLDWPVGEIVPYEADSGPREHAAPGGRARVAARHRHRGRRLAARLLRPRYAAEPRQHPARDVRARRRGPIARRPRAERVERHDRVLQRRPPRRRADPRARRGRRPRRDRGGGARAGHGEPGRRGVRILRRRHARAVGGGMGGAPATGRLHGVDLQRRQLRRHRGSLRGRQHGDPVPRAGVAERLRSQPPAGGRAVPHHAADLAERRARRGLGRDAGGHQQPRRDPVRALRRLPADRAGAAAGRRPGPDLGLRRRQPVHAQPGPADGHRVGLHRGGRRARAPPHHRRDVRQLGVEPDQRRRDHRDRLPLPVPELRDAHRSSRLPRGARAAVRRGGPAERRLRERDRHRRRERGVHDADGDRRRAADPGRVRRGQRRHLPQGRVVPVHGRVRRGWRRRARATPTSTRRWPSTRSVPARAT